MRKVKEEERPKYNFDVDVAKFTERQMEAVHMLDSGKVKFLLYGGALGGGKSYFLRWIAVRLLMSYFSDYGLKYVQVMLACEDYPSLKDRQISKMARQFPAWLGTMFVDHKEYGRCFILKEDYGSGVVCLRNLDDSAKYQSAEFAAILVDELTKNGLDVFTDLRMRLRWPGIPDMDCPFIGATNPGGIGHAFVKALWMDDVFPDEFLKPKDYSKTFGYIPSKAEDNPYLDDAYWAGLQTLPPHLRAAFRDGSWDLFKGQAFQEWSRNHHVVEPFPVPKGVPLFMTFDWGFGAPFSIGWWWIDSDGRKYRFNEWYGWSGSPNVGVRLSDPEIAAGIIKKENAMGFCEVGEQFGMKVHNPQITRLCDPTCFNKKPDYRGGGQMPSTAEVFMNNGLMMKPGDPSRNLKYRQFHSHLQIPRDGDGNVNGVPMLQIYSNCNHFIRTVPAMILDPNNIEDVDTDSEDHCLGGDTIVFHKELGAVKISDLVDTIGEILTPSGFIKYNRCWLTRKHADVVEVKVSNGNKVICTPDHKFMTNNGWIRAKRLTNEQTRIIILSKIGGVLCGYRSLATLFRSSWGNGIISAVSTIKKKVRGFIEWFGNRIMGRFQEDGIYITGILTDQITRLKTLPLSYRQNICLCMGNYPTTAHGLTQCTKVQENGMVLSRALHGIKNSMKNIARMPYLKDSLSYASGAEKNIWQNNGNYVVPEVVPTKEEEVLSVKQLGHADVYCFSLPTPHAFIINGGLISHNCYDDACHIMMHRPVRGDFKPRETVRPPMDITEIARLEREDIWAEVKISEERENALFEW